MTASTTPDQASGHRFARHLSYNIGGQVIPLVLAAVAVPMLVHHIGVDRFGLLTIAWMVVGYFSLFDLGLGRAMTRLVAERLGRGRADQVAQVVTSGLSLMSLLGVLGGVLLAVASPWMTDLLRVPEALRGETRNAFLLLAASVPAVVLSTGLRGVLEAHHRFGVTNAIRTPVGLWTFGGPLCVLPFTDRLDWVVATLVLGRYIALLAYAIATAREVGRLARAHDGDASWRELLHFGGWMTVSNVISPLMVYMDRFFIGALLGTSAVAYYTSPYEVVFKLNVVSEGLFGVLFPLMANRFAASQAEPDRLFSLGARMIAAGLFVPVVLIVALAEPFLGLWLGPDFALRSSVVMQVLALGLLVNGFSKVAFNAIQAHGRADVTARLHMIELPLYVVALIALTRQWGIVGAALAWSLRMVLDAALLGWMSRRMAGITGPCLRRCAVLALATLASAMTPLLLPAGQPLLRAVAVLALIAIAAAAFWRWQLDAQERGRLLGQLQQACARPRRLLRGPRAQGR
ncbi:flippase [Pseudoxanthomonas sp. UC19_8]|uniref:flippase n=1 Tax=Pseudoxanthomonas sp. UC19_8 TaxID=3350175 RepID=UPI0036D209D1